MKPVWQRERTAAANGFGAPAPARPQEKDSSEPLNRNSRHAPSATPNARMLEMVKRTFDIVASALLLLLLSPVMALTAILVWLSDPGTVFYRQMRVGRMSSRFVLLKFRSMKVNRKPLDPDLEVSGRDPLLTAVGRVIRRTKIDELPQLWNVLRGEMSLVGPRPVVPTHLARYSDFERRRLEVRPGMTGWAQINGNIAVPRDQRIAMDVWYVDQRSWWLDLLILLRTVPVILFGEKPNPRAIQEALDHAYRGSWCS